jgi:hypothetical protein
MSGGDVGPEHENKLFKNLAREVDFDMHCSSYLYGSGPFYSRQQLSDHGRIVLAKYSSTVNCLYKQRYFIEGNK